MQRVNDQYDWRRPPGNVIWHTIERVYSGKAFSDNYGYRHKKTIWVSELREISEIWLYTPIGTASMAAESSRNAFDPKPTLGQVNAWDVLTVLVMVQGVDADDYPKLAIVRNGEFVRPHQEHPVATSVVPCTGYYGLKCAYIPRLFEFRFPGDERILGPGELVFRWDQVEKRVPFSFDHLW